MKKKLEFKEIDHEQFLLTQKKFIELLENVSNELEVQKVEGYKLEDLKDGNLVQIFDQYHRERQSENNITKNMIYEKYLELYGYDSSNLKRFETEVISYLNREFEFYEMNNSFYKYCKTAVNRNYKLKKFVDNAPKILTYNIFSFVTIKGNDYEIEVPKELFTIYSTNKKQIDTMNKVRNFVFAAKELKLTYDEIIGLLQGYVENNSKNYFKYERKGLSNDLETINFDFNKILTIT